jgi:hypothetical protein
MGEWMYSLFTSLFNYDTLLLRLGSAAIPRLFLIHIYMGAAKVYFGGRGGQP